MNSTFQEEVLTWKLHGEMFEVRSLSVEMPNGCALHVAPLIGGLPTASPNSNFRRSQLDISAIGPIHAKRAIAVNQFLIRRPKMSQDEVIENDRILIFQMIQTQPAPQDSIITEVAKEASPPLHTSV